MKLTKNYSVFIVDDDEDDRESIKDAFLQNKHHYDYVFMQNGDQLLAYLVDNPIPHQDALILLDLNMPGKSGRDILKEIKDTDNLKPIPVIVLTTSSSEKDKEVSYQLGANCFVTKPDTYSDLVHITDSIAKLWLLPK
ncbi:MAG: response regulator [Bacteroidetes bacterium]|nr:response regulator [Bacteroidota bacterium]